MHMAPACHMHAVIQLALRVSLLHKVLVGHHLATFKMSGAGIVLLPESIINNCLASE